MASPDAMIVANSPDFQARVEYYLTKSAIAVMAENNTTGNHAERVNHAKLILGGQVDIRKAAVAVLTNVALDPRADVSSPPNNILDDGLEFTVNSMYNALAGVST